MIILKEVKHDIATNSVEATWIDRTITPAVGIEGDEDYQPEQQKHSVVRVIEKSDDVKFNLIVGSKIVVDSSMIEEIVINNTTYNIILENYVVGVL